MSDELLHRFPDGEGGPWSSYPPDRTDRILVLDIRWGAEPAVIDAIVDLARRHELVLYDPQGPDVRGEDPLTGALTTIGSTERVAVISAT